MEGKWLRLALPNWPAGGAKSTSLTFEASACSAEGLDSMQLTGAWSFQDSPGLWLPDNDWLSQHRQEVGLLRTY